MTSEPARPAADHANSTEAIDRRILDALNGDQYALTAYDLALEIFGEEVDYPSDHEEHAVQESLKRLESLGLVRSWETWIRDIGAETVWASSGGTKRLLDPGG